MDNINYPLKVSTGIYEVIHSGVVHLTGSEVKFELGNLVIKYRFKNDSNGHRFEGEVVDNALIINLYNVNNSMGEGKIEPVEIGTLGDRKLFATWYITTLPDNFREFNYTFMLIEG